MRPAAGETPALAFRLRKLVVALAGLACVLGGGVVPGRADARIGASTDSSATVFAEPQAGTGPVLSLIRRAKYRIRLEVYELTESTIISALATAKRRHVWVEVILEQHPFGGGSYAQEAYDALHRDGISVRWANESAFTYTHEKAMDVDNREAGIFTFNLSYSAFSTNREFGVIDRSSRDATQIGSIFDADWRRGQARLTDYQLVVSPIDSRSAITHLIDGAHRTLDLYEEEMDDTSMESHLIAAARRHVRVRLITSEDSSGVERVRTGGVRVVLMSSPYVHAKAIVADGVRSFIGSENISSTSLDHNRGNGNHPLEPEGRECGCDHVSTRLGRQRRQCASGTRRQADTLGLFPAALAFLAANCSPSPRRRRRLLPAP